MTNHRDSLTPIQGANRALRQRLSLKGELLLALLPTASVLIVFALVEAFSQQRLLFASLASSAFLIYLDPQHGTNTARTLGISQLAAALIGLLSYLALGAGYLSGGTAMILTILMMIVFDVVHPPAVSTSLSFALRAGPIGNLALFVLTLGMILLLVGVQRASLYLLARISRNQRDSRAPGTRES